VHAPYCDLSGSTLGIEQHVMFMHHIDLSGSTLGIEQHVKCMHHIVICPAVHYFHRYHINGTIFEEMLLNIKCVLIFFTTLYETLFNLRIIERGVFNL
jgi:hypothetical protein